MAKPPVRPARPEEVLPALRLLYQHLPADEGETYARRTRRLFEAGEFHADDLLALEAGGFRGAILCHVGLGASAQFWPPQVTGDDEQAEDVLVSAALAQLRGRGVKIVNQ